MSTAFAGMMGEAPTVLVQPVTPKVDAEQAKYEKAWAHAPYRDYSPGENAAATFVKLAKPSPKDTVIDFGAGTGRGSLMLAVLGCKVHMLDFARNCLDEEVRQCLTTQAHMMKFTQHDLRKESPVVAEYGYCTDVMEHIEPEEVDRVLHHILKAARNVFFQISTTPDHFGQHIGETLHLTVQPFSWWTDKLKEHGCRIHWSADAEGVCAFYVSAWKDIQELIDKGALNVEDQEIRDNIESAMKRGLTELVAHEPQDTRVMVLAGGPSMAEFKDEIIERRKNGEKLITVNGAYNWCIENGIVPSAHVMVDSREFNSRFVQPALPNVRYLLASQCHPATFDAVPAEQVVLWHSVIDHELYEQLEQRYLGTGKPWFPVLGGSTVMLRLIPLMVILGYSRFEIFGWDSCLQGDKHHAYAQPENDGQFVTQVLCNDRSFDCHPWMVSQAREFLDLMKLMAEHIELNVRGDGLIAWMIQTASEMGEASLEAVPTTPT